MGARMWLGGLAWLVLLLAGGLSRAASPAGEAALPTHPGVTVGTLENGLRYFVKPHANPPGRVYMLLWIDSGSINETEEQRGLAHFLEHMAFNGSKNFAPGTLIPFFESIGLTFGRHQNASTGFDRTQYLLDLPKNDRETVAKGFLFLSDVAGRLELSIEEIDKERQIIMEEKRARQGATQRVFEALLPRRYPGSRLSERMPIGVEEVLLGAGRDAFASYYERWYRPSNMALVVVGDVEVGTIAEMVDVYFADLGAGERVESLDAGLRVSTELRALVQADVELPYCGLEFERLTEKRGPTTTTGAMRRELVESLAGFAFNRRVRAKVDAGGMPFRGASASVSDSFQSATSASVQAIGQPDKWREMVAALALEVQRARSHGFTEREIEDVRRDFLSNARSAAAREETAPMRMVAMQIVRALGSEEPVMSARQRADLMEEMLPTITAGEVSAAFATQFDFSKGSVVLTIKETPGGVPSESALLEAMREAWAADTSVEEEADRPSALMHAAPPAGKIREMSIHPETGVFEAMLENGVRARHRFMDYRKNSATVTITLAGGQIEETASTRGLTSLAVLALQRAATARLSSTNVRDLLTGKDVRVFGSAGLDTVTISVSGAPGDLEAGMQLAHLLLTEPRIESAAAAQWKEAQKQGIEARKTQPAGALQEMLADSIYPKEEPRARPLESDEIDGLSVESAQAWLERIVRQAPMEVSVVGDIERERAVSLLTRYMGSLASRESMSTATLASLRDVARTPGPISARRSIETQTKQAVVSVGMYGTDGSNVRDSRVLGMAAQVLSTRLIRRIREEEQLVYSIRAVSAPSEAYPGFGLFYAASPTEPGKTERLVNALTEMFRTFAEHGPTKDEVEVARGQLLNTLEERMREPSFWQQALSDMSYRGVTIDEVLREPSDVASFTKEQVHEVFRRYYRPDALMTFVVTPVDGGPESP